MKVMKPLKIAEIPHGDKYIYEVKYDGGSAEIIKKGESIFIYHSGNPDIQNYKYPELLNDFKTFKDGHYIAELVVFNSESPGGHFPSFLKRQCENQFLIEKRRHSFPVTAMVYDMVSDNGDSCANETLHDRKKMLALNAREGNHIKLVKYYDTPDPILCKKNVFEGVVIKDLNSVYRFDRRDGWFKYRFNKEETVKCVSYENWESSGGVSGIVMTTVDGKRVNLAGPRAEEAKQKINDSGAVLVELSYNGKSEKGFRFTTVKRVL